jgi:UDP-N-acetyl-D-mannosaminuronic acid dehydrogenase
VHDPHVRTTRTAPFEQAVADTDAVIVATNHGAFRGHDTLAQIAALAGPQCMVVDPWNCWGAGQLFAFASELAALAAPVSVGS